MDKMTFEQAVSRIDEIVRPWRRGTRPWSSRCRSSRRGRTSSKFCGKLLDSAEQKVVRLQKGPDGAPEETAFDATGEADAARGL